MGSELRRMIRDGAPSTWTSLMRDVAKEIADDARDPSQGLPEGGRNPWSALPIEGYWDTRKQPPIWRDGLTEICGVSARAISDALTSLARAGYEMRQQIGTDKRGRPVYAAKGHAMRFEVPRLPLRPAPHLPAAAETPVDNSAVSTHSDATFGADSSHQGATYKAQSTHSDASFGAQRSHPDVPKVAPECDPVPPESPHEDQSPHTHGRARTTAPRGRLSEACRQTKHWPRDCAYGPGTGTSGSWCTCSCHARSSRQRVSTTAAIAS